MTVYYIDHEGIDVDKVGWVGSITLLNVIKIKMTSSVRHNLLHVIVFYLSTCQLFVLTRASILHEPKLDTHKSVPQHSCNDATTYLRHVNYCTHLRG